MGGHPVPTTIKGKGHGPWVNNFKYVQKCLCNNNFRKTPLSPWEMSTRFPLLCSRLYPYRQFMLSRHSFPNWWQQQNIQNLIVILAELPPIIQIFNCFSAVPCRC